MLVAACCGCAAQARQRSRTGSLHAERATDSAAQDTFCAEAAPVQLQSKHHCLIQTWEGPCTPPKRTRTIHTTCHFPHTRPVAQYTSQQSMHTSQSVKPAGRRMAQATHTCQPLLLRHTTAHQHSTRATLTDAPHKHTIDVSETQVRIGFLSSRMLLLVRHCLQQHTQV
jgi:hypothetical protein